MYHQATVAENFLINCIQKGGPDPDHYPLLNSWINSIDSDQQSRKFRGLFEPVLQANTLFGHTVNKPYGYAGDFEIIEKIYNKHRSEDSQWAKWDDYYHSFEATEAVRNRKEYFKELLGEYLDRSRFRVLILGSGPAADVHEFLTEFHAPHFEFDLLDIDDKAIAFARRKNRRYLNQLNFIRANVYRFQTDEKYDLIWSAGLFDYLNDKAFTSLTNRFSKNVSQGGKIVLGNFSKSNPTRRVMEVAGEWFLHHRSSIELMTLAMRAGIDQKAIHVEQEPLGINLFLHMQF